MAYWLIKSEPNVFSIDDMCLQKIEPWNGVRNFQARNYMKQMKKGDICFFYHSHCKDPGIVGLVCVENEYYPDPDDEKFVCVDVTFLKKIPLLSLAALKRYPALAHLALFRQSRLSVQPVDSTAADFILSCVS
ncbi:MAG: hypothetical protein CNLJKLNK_00732 [Holosporales bacterium]